MTGSGKQEIPLAGSDSNLADTCMPNSNRRLALGRALLRLQDVCVQDLCMIL